MFADPVFDSNGNLWGVSITIKNNGHSAASIKQAFASCVGMDADEVADYSKCEGLEFAGEYEPSETSHAVRLQLKTAGKPEVHVYGYVRYSDVYGRVFMRLMHTHLGTNVWLYTNEKENREIEEKPPHKPWAKRLEDKLDAIADAMNKRSCPPN